MPWYFNQEKSAEEFHSNDSNAESFSKATDVLVSELAHYFGQMHFPF
jgi:hypothetical protein